MSSLQLDHVWHRYQRAPEHSLREVSVTVDEGQMVSVVGPSGSGKSTLLRVAAGLERATTGQVSIDGSDVADRPIQDRDVTVMFQHPLLFDHLDVAGNVAFGPRLSGIGRRDARRMAREYLRLVHLDGYDRRAVASLSGGQQQRTALARALAAERGALLLDEPFSALDLELRLAMHELLLEVRAALAPTILMITHDLDEAALAESTVILIDGMVHQQAPMSELYQRPATLAAARLLGGFTEVRGTVHDGAHHSRWGAVPVPQSCETGDAMLLLRREALHLATPDAHPRTTERAGTQARVLRTRAAGARRVAVLTTQDHTTIEVELPVGIDVPVGIHTRVELADDTPRWALPISPDTGEAPDRPADGAGTPSDVKQPWGSLANP